MRTITKTITAMTPMQIARPIASIPVKMSPDGGPDPFFDITNWTVTSPVGVAPVPFTLSMMTVIEPEEPVNVPANCWEFTWLTRACEVCGGSLRYDARPVELKKYTSMFDPVTTWTAYAIWSVAPRKNVYPV